MFSFNKSCELSDESTRILERGCGELYIIYRCILQGYSNLINVLLLLSRVTYFSYSL